MRWSNRAPAAEPLFKPTLKPCRTAAPQVGFGKGNPGAPVERVCVSVLAHAVNSTNIRHAQHIELPASHATLTSRRTNGDHEVTHGNADGDSKLHRTQQAGER